ncbi:MULTISPECIES: GTPase Era [Pseudanabaena]|uniref:GTPase Era n=2 Tax=Pseudanabaena TaxID=1152 RepID=L8MZE9_9CYAN|nr:MULTISPECIES: GTPase Era [Pseudanabaena]ELS31358.1 GTP-binding protein Era-like-protein [Pseudanabaena biceps PCC 7429]MDG3496388.1 GTPase Era [Pseudanabaena catenata USMAC16]
MIPESGEGFKSGFVALVGRPNVGKSTLLNALIGQKIAITSPVAQTTRNRLRGILTLAEAQIVLVDTPGIHKPHHLLGQTIVKNAIGAISSVDTTVLVVDGSDRMGTGDRFVADTILQSRGPTILGINKIDRLDESIDTVSSYESFAAENGWQVAKFSSVTGEGLEALQTMMCDRLPLGPYYYPPDLVTDQPERFIMGELIREQILLLTREEIPHSVAVSIDLVDEQPKITRVMATVHVERDSQKGILIGKKGQMLKEIGTKAREQMQKLIMGSVHLEIFVKVQPKWRSSRFQLSDLGYRVE